MSHQLETTGDGATSFAYSQVHGSPWHRLGVPLEGLSTVQEILAASRADYEVHKAKLLTPDPGDPNPGRGDLLDSGMSYTWRERPIWMDDKDQLQGGDRHILGVVGNDYCVVQNRQVADLAMLLMGMLPDQPAADCAGVLDDGRRFFMTIPLPEVVLDPQGAADRHNLNLVATTGHDGGHSVQFLLTVVRAVCANTVQAALNEAQWRVSIRHTGVFNPHRVNLQRALGVANNGGVQFQVLAEALMAQPATFDLIKVVHDRMWGEEDEGASKRAQTIRANRLQDLEVIWASPKNTGAVGPNRWAALMTFSEYFEHHQRFAGSKQPNARALRATQVGGMHSRVHEAAQILQRV